MVTSALAPIERRHGANAPGAGAGKGPAAAFAGGQAPSSSSHINAAVIAAMSIGAMRRPTRSMAGA
jgi:hypothetical protein